LALAGRIDRTAHDPTVGLGRALAIADVSEHRFERLLTAHGAAMRDQIPRVARLLRAKGQPADFRALWWLLKAEDEGDNMQNERIRAQLARDYYVARARAEYRGNEGREAEG
jgi:CRISPR type I-E-associated protein CasB/Cse2